MKLPGCGGLRNGVCAAGRGAGLPAKMTSWIYDSTWPQTQAIKQDEWTQAGTPNTLVPHQPSKFHHIQPKKEVDASGRDIQIGITTQVIQAQHDQSRSVSSDILIDNED